jgi:hypothetical protein
MKPLTLLFLSGLLTATTHGALIVSYAENSEDFLTKLSGTSVYNFNSLSVNTPAPSLTNYTNLAWQTSPGTTVGTYDQVFVKGPDQYGGAPEINPSTGLVNNSGTNYSTIGSKYVTSTTLTFTSQYAYFGFWWSAGDDKNVMEFYNGATLVARFTTASLLNALASSPDYKGSPVKNVLNQNPTQSYAFVNFFGASGTTWNKIVFSNIGTSGFESDNHTIRTQPWGSPDFPLEVGKPYPGKPFASVDGATVTPIPEASSALLPLLGGMLLLRRRRC